MNGINFYHQLKPYLYNLDGCYFYATGLPTANSERPQKVCYIGIDEKAFRKGHDYMTVVCNLIKGKVEYVAEGHKTASLEEYYASLTEEQLGGIKAISMDMWQPYFLATMKYVPGASNKVVFDRFHIMQHVCDAVDKVRRQENKVPAAEADNTLKGTKHLWLYSQENLPDKHRPHFEELRESCLKTAKAWAMKEGIRRLWDYLSSGWAKRYLKRWCLWVKHSNLEPMKKVARMVLSHIENIVTYCNHRVSNGVAEGLNSKIMSIKRRACGYRNKGHFKTAIYFFCGGLDLYPASSKLGATH